MKFKLNTGACLALSMSLLLMISCEKEEVKDHSILYAFFNTAQQNVSTGDTVHFEDLSLGNPTAWKWTFEGGNPATSTEQSPAVVYSDTGTYKVSLEVSGGGETSVKETEGYIAVVKKDYLKDYLTVYYPFDGSLIDEVLGTVGANVSGNVLFNGTDRHSNTNAAAVFDGSSAIIVPDNPAFNFGTADFTISCWLKTSQQIKMMVWQESGAKGGGDNQSWLRIGDNTTNRLMRFDTEDAGGGSILNYGNGAGSGVADNAWHQVICVREGATTRLYVDGVKKGELVKSAVKNVSNDQDFKIGTQEGPLGSYHTYFTGAMDDFKVFDKALTDQDVTYLYEQEK